MWLCLAPSKFTLMIQSEACYEVIYCITNMILISWAIILHLMTMKSAKKCNPMRKSIPSLMRQPAPYIPIG
jgi:hypothetical protein